MNNLSNDIYNYYTERFFELPFDKQLHFASRLYLWSHDAFARERLDELRATVTADGQPDVALKDVYMQGKTSIFHGSKNAAELRAPYFEKYPELRTLVMVLFRLTFLQTVYGLDGRTVLFKLYDRSQVEALLQQLSGDTQAVAVLSTHAINVLYLYNRVVLQDDLSMDPTQFLHVGASAYDLSDPIQLQLYIYLYTHCVIGESTFYARKLPDTYLHVYRQMMQELELVIGENFTAVNLDNKFEFLVCCRLVGYKSNLARRIEDEAERSISEQGLFLIDRHNTNPQAANSTLELSEHRNVLYLLSHLDSPLTR
ncbi:MAG TPA: hypothetical protein VMB52_03060 [Verrucomicrobiae bacterium]|nr:hypothetical protein [Verrucomicrobiae bacterium]